MARSQPKHRAHYLPAATADLGRLEQDNHRLVVRAQALVELIVDREIEGEELKLLASYGDLTDCRKIYFGVTSDPTHRIVYRLLADGAIEVVEVVAVEQREEGYVYLLAAQRLARLPAETKKRLTRVHQGVIQRRSDSRKRQQ